MSDLVGDAARCYWAHHENDWQLESSVRPVCRDCASPLPWLTVQRATEVDAFLEGQAKGLHVVLVRSLLPNQEIAGLVDIPAAAQLAIDLGESGVVVLQSTTDLAVPHLTVITRASNLQKEQRVDLYGTYTASAVRNLVRLHQITGAGIPASSDEQVRLLQLHQIWVSIAGGGGSPPYDLDRYAKQNGLRAAELRFAVGLRNSVAHPDAAIRQEDVVRACTTLAAAIEKARSGERLRYPLPKDPQKREALVRPGADDASPAVKNIFEQVRMRAEEARKRLAERGDQRRPRSKDPDTGRENGLKA